MPDQVHNARITLLATACNNTGVGAIIAGIVSPVVNGRISPLWIGVWLLVGAGLVFGAQVILGRLRAS